MTPEAWLSGSVSRHPGGHRDAIPSTGLTGPELGVVWPQGGGASMELSGNKGGWGLQNSGRLPSPTRPDQLGPEGAVASL